MCSFVKRRIFRSHFLIFGWTGAHLNHVTRLSCLEANLWNICISRVNILFHTVYRTISLPTPQLVNSSTYIHTLMSEAIKTETEVLIQYNWLFTISSGYWHTNMLISSELKVHLSLMEMLFVSQGFIAFVKIIGQIEKKKSLDKLKLWPNNGVSRVIGRYFWDTKVIIKNWWQLWAVVGFGRTYQGIIQFSRIRMLRTYNVCAKFCNNPSKYLLRNHCRPTDWHVHPCCPDIERCQPSSVSFPYNLCNLSSWTQCSMKNLWRCLTQLCVFVE